MNKHVLLGILFFVIFLAGLAVILSNASVGFDEFMRALSDLNPRFLSLLALPVVAVLFVLGVYLRRKSEDRMWKKAVRDTRSNRDNQR